MLLREAPKADAQESETEAAGLAGFTVHELVA